MNDYGVILKKLRLLKKLPIREAAQQLEKSVGWLSEIENGKGAARINEKEFERILAIYDGEAYRKQFGAWITHSHRYSNQDTSFGGAVLRYLRKKAGLTLKGAAEKAGVSESYLSFIETGSKPLSANFRDGLMKIYGYSPSSFKNFASEDKRAKNVPGRYKLAILINRMDEASIDRLLCFALSMTGEPSLTGRSA